jgi:hypothetical protein
VHDAVVAEAEPDQGLTERNALGKGLRQWVCVHAGIGSGVTAGTRVAPGVRMSVAAVRFEPSAAQCAGSSKTEPASLSPSS